MKLPDFDYSQMMWDHWNAFHVNHDPNGRFVQFDTGEFIVCRRGWPPAVRVGYSKLNIQVVATGDGECPRLAIPGSAKPIPKSHLNHRGQQYLLLDHDHRMAVSLGGWFRENKNSPVPQRFVKHSCVSVYYNGSCAKPIGAVPIARCFPQPLTPKQHQRINALNDACKVWLQMRPPNLDDRGWPCSAPPVLEFVDASFSALTTAQRYLIALRGFDRIIKEEHAFLTF